jgi:hypothetical protein
MNDTSRDFAGWELAAVDRFDRRGGSLSGSEIMRVQLERTPNKITGANSRPASQFESRGLRPRAPVVGSRSRHHGGAAVAQFCRSAEAVRWS